MSLRLSFNVLFSASMRRSAVAALCAGAVQTHAGAAPVGADAAAAGPGATVVAGLGAAIAPAQLDAARGGNGGIATTATLLGTVSGNSANNVVTGGNTITASAFAGASGIPIVIQNSGANVLIQNATVINLQFQ
jgi:hypothetical protein